MILAAGFGRRLRPLTDHTPKPLLVVQGKPLIQYHLEHLAEAGITDIVINHAWLGEQLETTLGDGSAFGVDISWSRELLPLETGGGIKRALPLLASVSEQTDTDANTDANANIFLLVSADVWTNYRFKSLSDIVLNEMVLGDRLAHLVLTPNPEHNMEGDFSLDQRGNVGVKQASQVSLTYTGIALINPAIFDDYEHSSAVFPLREVLGPAVAAGKVSGEVFHGDWSDVGTIERLNALNN